MAGLALAEQALQVLFNADNLTADKIAEIAKKVARISTEIKVEIGKVRAFKVDIHWKNRVIHVPTAIESIKELLQELTDGVREKIQGIEQPFKDFASAVHASESEFVDPALPKITTSISKVQEFVTNLNILVGDISTALDEVIQLQSLFERVLKDIETLDDIFLPQKSKRTKTTLTYFKRNS